MGHLCSASSGVITAVSALLILTSPSAHADSATANASALGVWMDDTGRGAVEIRPCGTGAELCGHVVWVRDGSDKKGCGRQIIGSARAIGRKGLHQGWIYSPEKKKRFDVEFAPAAEGKLRVMGYAGIKLFSRTMYWTRASDDLVRCDATKTPSEVAQKSIAANPPASPVPTAPRTQTNAKGSGEAATSESNSQKVVAHTEPRTGRKPAAPGLNSSETAKDSQPPDAADQPSGAEANKDTDADDTAGDGEDGSEPASLSKLDLGDLKLDKFLSRENGNCKLDLPWVKVSFDCKDL